MAGADKAATKNGAAPKGAVAAQGVVTVCTLPGVERFCRAGMCFGPEPTKLVIAELAEGVLERLQAEPNLVLSSVEG